MRQLPFFMLLALAVSLGGCASSPPSGVCARIAEPDFRHQELAMPSYRNRSLPHMAVRHPKPSHEVLPTETTAGTPEPRPTSTEWWMRENARLGKAIIICRGCLPAATVSLPKPAVLSTKPDPHVHPSTVMNGVEGSVAADTLDHP
jgi:hypothetical protein